MPPSQDITREELFRLLWLKPLRDVASELGVTEGELGTYCRRWNIPRPPRGYWHTRQRAGRPPKPPLPEYLDEYRRAAPGQKINSGTRLTPLQKESFYYFARYINADDSSQLYTFDGDYIEWIDSGFAASMLFSIQSHISKRGSIPSSSKQKSIALNIKAEELAEILHHFASDLVVSFEVDETRSPATEISCVFVRLSPDLRKMIAALATMVRDNELVEVVRSIDRGDYGWRVRYAMDPERQGEVRTALHVTSHDVWVEVQDIGAGSVFRSEAWDIGSIVPEDQIGLRTCEFPPPLPSAKIGRFRKRFRELARAENLRKWAIRDLKDSEEWDIVGEEIPDLMRIFLNQEQWEALNGVRLIRDMLTQKMDEWEAQVSEEENQMARDLLGVRPTDILCMKRRGKSEKLFVTEVVGYISDDGFVLICNGKRIRKDGTVGKTWDQAVTEISWNSIEGRRENDN